LESDIYNYSFYINDQVLLFGDALILSAGLRRDENEVFGGETTGKVGSAYTFYGLGSTLFANYGTSFRAPTIFNIYDAIYGNEDLSPETGWTIEGGIRQDLADGRINLEATYWYSELDNVIIFDYSIPNPASSVGSGKYANQDAAETSGVEVVIGAQITEHINLEGNYTYTDSFSEKDGVRSRMVQIARNKGSLTLSYQADRFKLGVTGYYSGPRLRYKGDIEMEEYFRVDLFGRFGLTDSLNLYGRVENLLDEDIEEGLGYEQPGVYGIVGLEWTI
jgi:outer membrane cobalamin receptor